MTAGAQVYALSYLTVQCSHQWLNYLEVHDPSFRD
jgi:hypothetical protein